MKKYGQEIREKYGDVLVNKSNEKLLNMAPEEYEEATHLLNEVKGTLAEAFKIGDPASDLAQKAADFHKRWLSYYCRHLLLLFKKSMTFTPFAVSPAVRAGCLTPHLPS
jgi:hypothetical protein